MHAQAQVCSSRYDRDNTEAMLLKGQLLVSRKEFDAAANELKAYVKLRPDDAAAHLLAKRCAGNTTDPSVQEAMGNTLIGQKQLLLGVGLLQENEKRLAIYRKQIAATWPDRAHHLGSDSEHRLSFGLNGSGSPDQFLDLTPLQGIPISSLRLEFLKISDLRLLRGMPLTSLTLDNLPNLKELPPFQGVPLTSLEASNCRLLEDLSGLKGVPLEHLQIQTCMRIKDLTPLKEMPLKKFAIKAYGGTGRVEDVSPLQGAPLEYLYLDTPELCSIEPLRNMPLRTLWLLGCSKLTHLSPLQGFPWKN